MVVVERLQVNTSVNTKSSEMERDERRVNTLNQLRDNSYRPWSWVAVSFEVSFNRNCCIFKISNEEDFILHLCIRKRKKKPGKRTRGKKGCIKNEKATPLTLTPDMSLKRREKEKHRLLHF